MLFPAPTARDDIGSPSFMDDRAEDGVVAAKRGVLRKIRTAPPVAWFGGNAFSLTEGARRVAWSVERMARRRSPIRRDRFNAIQLRIGDVTDHVSRSR